MCTRVDITLDQVTELRARNRERPGRPRLYTAQDLQWFMDRPDEWHGLTTGVLVPVSSSRVLSEGQTADAQALMRHAVQGVVLSLFATCLTDEAACELPGVTKELAAGIRALRTANTDWSISITAPIVRLVDTSLHLPFYMKQAARHCGPCRENFMYMKDWQYDGFADEFRAGRKYLVIGSPVMVPDSTAKTMDGQKALLSDMGKKLNLGFKLIHGSAALGAYLALSHLRETGGEQNGQRLPGGNWIRTDSMSGGHRLTLWWRDDDGSLYCDGWRCGGDERVSYLGCLALGVVALGR